MARSRMVSTSLPGSKKLAAVRSVEAAWLFSPAGMGATDREGRFEADEDSLARVADRFGRSHGWSYEDLLRWRKELADAQLWIVYEWEGREIAQVVDYHKHNCSHWKERPSDFPPPDGYSDEAERAKYERKMPAIPGPWAQGWASDPGKPSNLEPSTPSNRPTLDEKPGEVEVEVEIEVEAEVVEGGGGGNIDRAKRNTPTHEARAQRLVDCWTAAHTRVNAASQNASPLIRPPADFYEAEKAATALGDTIDLFKDDETLAKELARLICVYDEKGWVRTFKGILRHLGQEFPGTEHPNPVIYQEEVADGKTKI